MRKIEQQMNDAVANNKTWQSANTSVHFNEETNESIVRLHGNKIAVIGDNFMQIFDGGWQSNTTKSRLNALIDRFCNGMTDGVYQRQHVWYLKDNNVEREFVDGYIYAQSRPANYYANQVKVLLLIVIAILFWNSEGARNFTADTFNNAAQIIRAN
jgi:hypothetical protein